MPRSARTWAYGSTWKELLLTIIGTTISIILTFGTAACLDRCERVDDRKMSALMVMSNIESFSRNVDLMAQDIARCDSIGTWLLSLPQDRLDKISPEEASDIINEVIGSINFLSHDKTAESIFSNNIETWKNMDNFQFIDNVGKCFAKMNSDENNWNEWVTEFESAITRVIEQMQPNERTLTKLLSDNTVRQKIESFHVRKNWLDYISAYHRNLNSQNMVIIGVTKQEVMAFTDERGRSINTAEEEPIQSSFRTKQLSVDSLTTLTPLIQHIDSILYNKK
jgi:hypothetical protein